MTEHSIVPSGVLQRIGSAQERQYLMEVLAEQLGIPAHEAGRADVVAILANAVQRSVQFGWLPGVHMHIQKFESTESRKERERNPNHRAVYTYTLVDGEKAWKDSAARWRTDYGVKWSYQRKEMSREEIEQEARLMNYTQAIAPNSFGYWCRIVEEGIDDPNDADNPTWAAGVWFGKVSVGNYWRDDRLPTGNSSRDVALRRADKRAIMQSRLSLLPVVGNSDEERLQQLVDTLRREREFKEKHDSIPVTKPLHREADGNVLLAPTKTTRNASTVESEDAVDGVWEETAPTDDNPFDSTAGEFNPYAVLLHNTDIELSKQVVSCMDYMRGIDRSSDIPMPVEWYDKLCTLVDTVLGGGEEVHGMVLSALVGLSIDRDRRPGEKIAELGKWLAEPEKNKGKIEILKEVVAACMEVKRDMETV